MDLPTRKSLLDRLGGVSRAGDWEIFYNTYAALILSFARKQGLDEHHTYDALQETMLVVMRAMSGFDYDPARGRFRNWLLTIATNKIREARRRSGAGRLVSLESAAEDGEPWREKLIAETRPAEAGVESAWRESLLEEALRRLLEDPHTKPETVAVFRACALENEPAAEVAWRFGMKENAVYQVKNRMMTRLRSLFSELEQGVTQEVGG
jgi:RNA polymerase sigma factor (sigma-70 family)